MKLLPDASGMLSDIAFRVSSKPDEVDVALVHRFLSEQSHWATGISLERVQRSIDHSLCFAGLLGPTQVAFGRVVTDYTHVAYVMDVFVLPEHRGSGYSKAIVKAMLMHPELQGVTFLLRTAHAQGLYTPFGFAPLANPEKYLRYAPGNSA